MGLTLLIGDKFFSSWSMRARILLLEKGISYSEQLISLDWPVRFTDVGVEGVADYDIPPEPATACGCDLSQIIYHDPTGKVKKSIATVLPRVPLLIDSHHDVVVYDVLAIAEYLDDLFDKSLPRLLGSSPEMRARVRSFSSHIHGDYLPLLSGMSFSHSFRENRPPITEEAIRQMGRLVTVMDYLLKISEQPKQFLFGESFTLADAMVAPIAQQVRGWQYEVSSPYVAAYFAQLLKRESVAHHLNEAEQPYNNIKLFNPKTPAWIAAHYRYLPEAALIHNWQTDVYHLLEGDVAVRTFELATSGLNLHEICARLIQEFDVPFDRCLADISSFFEKISPLRADISPGNPMIRQF